MLKMGNYVSAGPVFTVPTMPVPDHVRQFIVSNYNISPDADMYISRNEPNKVVAVHDGFVEMIDFASPSLKSPTIITDLASNSGNVPPNCTMFASSDNVFSAYNTNCTHVGYSDFVAQSQPLQPLQLVDKPLELQEPPFNSEVLRNRQIRAELNNHATTILNDPNSTKVLKAVNELPEVNSSEWHKLTDSERELIQRERRKANAYKTALCQSFKESGTCEYGEECRFAHGESELRLPPQAHPKYKTQLCNKFSVRGYCPYGSRCQFIHQRPTDVVLPKSASTKQNSVLRVSNATEVENVPHPFAEKHDDTIKAPRTIRNKENKISPSAKICLPWHKLNSGKQSTDAFKTDQKTVLEKLIKKEDNQDESVFSRAKPGFTEIFDQLALTDSDSGFSQSCFPRLLSSPGWLSSLDSK